jgi:hypothetical protein
MVIRAPQGMRQSRIRPSLALEEAPQLTWLRRQHVLLLQRVRMNEPDCDPLAPVTRQSPLRMPPSLQAMFALRLKSFLRRRITQHLICVQRNPDLNFVYRTSKIFSAC